MEAWFAALTRVNALLAPDPLISTDPVILRLLLL